MITRPHLPGYSVLRWVRIPWLRTGLYTGICLSLMFVAWLFVANRAPALEPFAYVRNAITVAVLVLLLLVPALSFARRPLRLFASGTFGWGLLALTYRLMEEFFDLLEDRIGAFHLFMLGAIVYLVLAAISWVALLLFTARQSAAHVPGRKAH